MEAKEGFEWVRYGKNVAADEELRAVRTFRLLDLVIRKYTDHPAYPQYCCAQVELALKYHKGDSEHLPLDQQCEFTQLVLEIVERLRNVANDLEIQAVEQLFPETAVH